MVDIWSLARQRRLEEAGKRTLQQQQQQQNNTPTAYSTIIGNDLQATETHLIICGSKNCGKTSMVLRFLDRNENPRPTIALEYTYGRRTRGQVKDVGNIWELGGGTKLCNLLQIPLSHNKIPKCSLMIVIDLTAPLDMWSTFYTLLDSARTAVDGALQQFARKSASGQNEAFQDDRKARFKEHKDAENIDPFPIPLILIGAKYDEFQNFEPELRKNVCKILRFMAHTNGATLAMFSNKMENLVMRTRALISSAVFGTTAPKTVSVDYNKPVSIPYGADSLMDIGTPPHIDASLSRIGVTNLRELWHEAYLELYPAREKHQQKIEDDPVEDAQYKEPEIDALIEHRTRELEQYIRHKKDRAALEAKAQQLQQR